MPYCYVRIYLLILLQIYNNQTKPCNLFFLHQGQNGFFILDLTRSSDKNERKTLKEMKVCFRDIQVRKKGIQERNIFFKGIEVKGFITGELWLDHRYFCTIRY